MDHDWKIKGQYIDVLHGDCIRRLQRMRSNCIDSIVTDPPYALTGKDKSKGFMGKTWDTGEVAFNIELWKECLRVIRPGGYLVAFSSTRTYHRMVCAIEDAGFEIRDQLQWLHGQGFPKSLNVSKAIESKIVTGKSSTTKMRKVSMGDKYKPYSGAGNFRDGTTLTKNSPNPKGADFAPKTEEAKQWEGWGDCIKTSR